MEPEEGDAPWWVGLPPVEIMIGCGDGLHTLRWSEGALAAPDHPDAGRRSRGQRPTPVTAADVEGGGCDVALRAWRAYRHDPRVLTWGRRHPGETLRANGPAAEEPLAMVLATLEPSLERRLQAESAVALADDVLAEAAAAAALPDDAAGGGPGGPGGSVGSVGSVGSLGETSEAAMLLEAATAGRAATVLERWLGPAQPYEVRLGLAPSVREVDGIAVVTVAPTWIAQVWSRYLALVGGFLVIEVERIVEDRAQVIGVGRLGGDPARVTVAGPAPWKARGREPL